MKQAYFAHPFELWKTPKELEIMEMISKRGWVPFNPLTKEDWLNVKYEVQCYYDNPTVDFAHEIVAMDLKALDESQILIAYLPGNFKGIGTIMEIMYAWKKKKYIVIISEGKKPSRWQRFLHRILEIILRKRYVDRSSHPWILSAADEFYSSLEDFVNQKNEIRWKLLLHHLSWKMRLRELPDGLCFSC